MYCTNCGTKIPDDASFCPACGHPVNDAAQPNGNTEQSARNTETQYESAKYQTQGSPGTSADAVINIGRSPLVLALSIVFSAELVFSLVSVFFGSSNFIISLLSFIIAIVICVGCWLVYANSSRNRFDSTGFSVLRVGVPIYLALQILSAIITIYESSFMFSGVARLAEYIAGLAMVAVYVWCYYGLYRITNDGWKILKGEAVKWRVPMSCIVILIVSAAIDALIVLLCLIYSAQFIIILQALTSTVVCILAIVILFTIRKENSLSA